MPSSQHQWTILGAGSVGHLIACSFAQSNIAATLITRNAAMPEKSIVGYKKDDSSLNCSLNYSNIGDLPKVTHLLLTVKSWQVEEAILSIKDHLDAKSHIYLLQNGMGNLEKVSDLLGDIIDPKHIYPCVNTHGCYIQKSKTTEHKQTIIHAGLGSILVGNNYLFSSNRNPPTSFTDLSRLPLKMKWSTNIEHELWMKLAVNVAINPVTAINQCKNGVLEDSAELKHQVTLLCMETAKLYQKLELNIDQEAILKAVFDVIQLTAENQSSMLQDIKLKKKTEIDAITGYLLRYSVNLDVELKLHQYYYSKVQSLLEI